MFARGNLICLSIVTVLMLCAANSAKPHADPVVTRVQMTSSLARVAASVRSDCRSQPVQMLRRTEPMGIGALVSRSPWKKSPGRQEGISELLSNAVIARLALAEINSPRTDHRVMSTWLRI